MAAASPWSRPTERAGRAGLRADLQRPRPRDPPPGAAASRASRPSSAFSATACPTARRGSTSSSSPPPRRCRRPASCSAAPAGATGALPRNVRYLGHVGTADHNAFNCSAAGGAQRQPRQHGGLRLLAADPRVRGGGCRRLPDHRRLGRDRAVPRARTRGAGGARTGRRWPRTSPSSTQRSARARSAPPRGPASWPSTPTTSGRRRSRRCWPAARRGRRRHEARRPRPQHHLVLGQRPRHHLSRPACASSPAAATR